MKKKAARARTKVDSPTRAKQKAFLEAYSRLGTITHAAESAGVARDMHYRWLETDSYAKEYGAAQERFVDRVRDAVRLRAIDGWEEPIVYQGRIQTFRLLDDNGDVIKDKNGNPVEFPATVRKFSERLLELLAKAKAPEFKDKLELGATESLGEIMARSYEQAKAKP